MRLNATMIFDGVADRSSRTADSLQTETSQIAVSNGWVTDAK